VRVGIMPLVDMALCSDSEDLCIVAMNLNWPDLPALLVRASSVATVAKSVLATAAVMFAIWIGVFAAKHRIRPAS